MIKYNAYIDETGEPIFSEGSSKTFFLCAIVMNQCNVEKNQALLSHIKSKYKVQHLKSSKMHDFSKRLAICEELAQLDIQIATINVKKDKLNGEWFRVKPTFYKYIQSLLNHRLYQSFGTLDVSIDRFGSLQISNLNKTIFREKNYKGNFLNLKFKLILL